jgi:hypothetical protein
MAVTIRIVAILVASASISGTIVAQNHLADLRNRFVHEPNPVAKAKLMPQLGGAEFAEIDSDVMQEKLPEALAVLQSYRDEVESCDKALDAAGLDAEKHPGGFKQLEFSLRDSLRRLDAVIVNMTTDEQAPFVDVRRELGELNQHLIEHLFPHAPPPKPAPDAAKQ